MNILENALAIIAPHECIVCKKEGHLLCNWCKPEAVLAIPSRCYKCQAMSDNFAVCVTCQRKTALRHVWVASEYNGTAKQLVQNLKYQYKRSAAPIIAEYLDQTVPRFGEVVVTHVPTATSRIRQRGFDQAQLIAKQFAKSRNWAYSPLLLRQGHSQQVGAKRAERTAQLQGAFLVMNNKNVQNKTILLIDDVSTTGATIESAARILKHAGAKQVNASVFAQAL